MRRYHTRLNFLSEGVRLGLDKEIRLDGTYLAYFPFSRMIERSRVTPYHKKLLYNNIPVVYILNTAILNALEVVVHLLTCLTNLHAIVVSHVVVEVIESTDR